MKSIHLTAVEIHKYKCIEKPQRFDVDERVTVLVGKNESGKTAVLQSIAKTNYFSADPAFRFSTTDDYPRKELKKYQKSGETADVVTSHYRISESVIEQIESKLGKDVLKKSDFSITTDFDNAIGIEGIEVDFSRFIEHFLSKHEGVDPADAAKLRGLASMEAAVELKTQATQEHALAQAAAAAPPAGAPPTPIPEPSILKLLAELDQFRLKDPMIDEPIADYIYSKFIAPLVPKFLYYDEYYELPSRVDIQKLQSGKRETEQEQTAAALFELAEIDIKELVQNDRFESYVAELEATANFITQELFEYWKTNTELRVRFMIESANVNGEIRPFLNIRVENTKHMMTLPLGKRSKGFNWFFSFLVWFSKIQEDKNSNFILLLDEPGLNLHASAQADLLRYIESLSDNYQILYSTHSPFMVESHGLHRVRTIYDGPEGSIVSDSIQERDADTLFPLQAALGYDIAQNLFVSRNNLIVEGAADLVILTHLSAVLTAKGMEGLDESVTIVPAGGLDKVTSFVSLLRGSKLNIACLLDTFTDQKGKRRLDDLVSEKIIREKQIMFFDKFASVGDVADLEDLFEPQEYLDLFNAAFSGEVATIRLDQLLAGQRILPQINRLMGRDRFNHYRPARILVSSQHETTLSEATLRRFEAAFKAVNQKLAQ
jgi:predicted ATPase